MRNWAGNVEFGAARVHHPTTVAELQEIVASSRRLRALGTGHSFNRIADTDGDLVVTRGLGSRVEVDADAMTVAVAAGADYGAVASALHEQGLALANLGSLPHIAVAGACATGTHGSGDGNRCLAASAVAVEFVRADGELVRTAAGDPAFAGSVLALGALGVITTVTLAVEPTFDLVQHVWLDTPLATVCERFDEIVSAGYSVSLFSGAARPDVVDQIWVKTRVDGPLADGRTWGARAAAEATHPTAGHDAHAVTEQLGVPGPWHERLPHFRAAAAVPSNGDEQQSEYLLPREHGPVALERVHRLGLGDLLLSLEIRTVAADELWLSPCHGRASVGVHFTWRNDDVAVAAALERVEDALAPFDPRPHWAKVFGLEPATVRERYERRADLAALAAEHDPEQVFGNDFLHRFLY